MSWAAEPRRRPRREHLARTVQALADGRPAYVRALADELIAMRAQRAAAPAGDPISALARALAP